MSLFPIISPPAPVLPVVVAYVGENDIVASGTVFTFSGEAIGTASAGRFVIVGAFARGGGSATSTITVGGITAVKAVEGSDPVGGYTWTLHAAAVPSGTTADIIVTWSGTMAHTVICVWEMTNAGSTTAYDTSNDVDNSDPLVTAMDVEAGGAIVGFSGGNAGNGAHTWTGITEDSDFDGNGGDYMTGASLEFAAADSSKAVNCAGGLTSRNGMVAAAWSS